VIGSVPLALGLPLVQSSGRKSFGEGPAFLSDLLTVRERPVNPAPASGQDAATTIPSPQERMALLEMAQRQSRVSRDHKLT